MANMTDLHKRVKGRPDRKAATPQGNRFLPASPASYAGTGTVAVPEKPSELSRTWAHLPRETPINTTLVAPVGKDNTE